MNFDFLNEIPFAKEIFEDVKAANGKAFLVGGCVRDALLGNAPKDFDVEVFGLAVPALEKIFRSRGISFNAAGKSFGVFKIHGAPLDISLPRRESKIGIGHCAFEIRGDPFMPLPEAASRRDFTINSIYFDPLEGKIFDPFSGQKDLEKKILRHTSAAFPEDPLRVLRAMQFLARFEFEIAPETLEICKKIVPENLSRERIFDEFSKLILKGNKISRGLEFLKNCGWIKYFPELEALVGVEQDKFWHPEGDVWNHTLKAFDAFADERNSAAETTNSESENLAVGFAVLCHDFGKALTTTRGNDGKIRAPGHEKAGVVPAEKFLRALTNQTKLIEEILVLVENHMAPRALYKTNSDDPAVKKLAHKVGKISRLLRVCRADARGSEFHKSEDFLNSEKWLRERAKALQIYDSAPEQIVLGRHILALGISPNKNFSKILKKCFDAQLDGEFSDEAGGVAFLKNLLENKKI